MTARVNGPIIHSFIHSMGLNENRVVIYLQQSYLTLGQSCKSIYKRKLGH